MARDPYQYFRIEAREILEQLGQGVLEMEKGAVEKGLVARLLRLAHTLKGAARVVKQPGIAEVTHALEDLLALRRDDSEPVARAQIDEMLRLLDRIAAQVTAIDVAPAAPGAGPGVVRVQKSPQRPAPDEPFETVRVALGEMDALLKNVASATAQLDGLHEQLTTLERTRHLGQLLLDHLSPRRGADAGAAGARPLAEELRDALDHLQRALTSGMEKAERELAQVRDAVDRLRLLPASVVFAALERAARDAAQSGSKRCEFVASGGEIRLDAHVLAALQDALLHVVRNAVAHGIESEAERAAAGKVPFGRIELRVERRGARVAFVCQDDGRGIDVEAVRRAAVRRGVISDAEAGSMRSDDVTRLLLRGGVTTSEVVTQIAGRGIGLDVFRETAARLKGEVSVKSEAGRGATFTIAVPISFSSMRALLVEAGGVVASLPLDAVRRTLRVTDGEIARSGESDAILYEGQVVPFAPLATILSAPTQPTPGPRPWSVVVVGSGSALAALGVDRMMGAAEVVLRRLPVLALVDPVVAALSLDAQGNARLALDPASVVAAARAARRRRADAGTAPRPSILVIDDSLTTRMLEQSILESAGYQVELATSAEEALVKARERRYGLFVVDVEMPGMNGFEFLSVARADASLRDIPAIMVTSRNAEADRRRSEEVGARAYIVKSEFDQGYLLQTIRVLIG